MQTSVEKSDPICVCHEDVCEEMGWGKVMEKSWRKTRKGNLSISNAEKKGKRKSVCCCYCSRSSPPSFPRPMLPRSSPFQPKPKRPKTRFPPRPRKERCPDYWFPIHPSLHPSRFPVAGCDVCCFFPWAPCSKIQDGKGQDKKKEKQVKKGSEQIHRLERKKKKKMISLLFPVLSPIFSLPEQIPLDPSENETLLFFASFEKIL